VKLPSYAVLLGIPAAVLTQVQQDADNFSTMIGQLTVFREYEKQLTGYKNNMRSGSPTNAPIGTIPAVPSTIVFTNPPVANIFGRASKLVQVIKGNPNYNPATIGKDLGIIGDDVLIDINNVKPLLSYVLETGKPNIIWKKGGLQGVHIFVDRGTGLGYQFLATDTEPDYLDTFPLPAAGQTAIWKYKAIYILHDEEVGMASDELIVQVKSVL